MLKQKYFIAIIPNTELSEQITLFRKQYLPGINLKDEHKKFPHITLQHTFSRTEEIEEPLTVSITALIKKISPFNVHISGAGHFDKRIIYLKVESNPELTGLHEDIKNMLCGSFGFLQNEVAAAFTPHITLEKKLVMKEFDDCWEKIRDVHFEKSFMADSVSLMRHTGIKWIEARRFDME